MALRQSCPLGGSITLNATDTANTYVLDLPASNGTLATTADIFPVGTVIPFAQAAAPTGWTQVTSYNNYALRIVSGTGGGTGGSVGFTTAFASQAVIASIGSTTLSTSQIPSHTHSIPFGGTGGTLVPAGGDNGIYTHNTGTTGGGGSHTHSFTGTAIDLAVQYIDTILASKN